MDCDRACRLSFSANRWVEFIWRLERFILLLNVETGYDHQMRSIYESYPESMFRWTIKKKTRIYYKPCTGCGRKNTPIWEGHSFGWGARTVVGSMSSNSIVRTVFSLHHGMVGRTSSLYCWGVYKNGGSPVATQRAFRIRFALGRREAVPDNKTIYRWVSNFRQTGQTLEALKEAKRQEVAGITPEMILKVMDNYREATSVYQYSRPPIEWWFIQNILM